MCSIFGSLNRVEGTLEAFNTLAHRGEDSSKYLKTSNFFFGSHRLSIESIGKEQNQPLQRGDYIALFNGEIYNYKELISTHNLNANDEIETILELFKLYKTNFVKKLRGMFAIAIYNIKSKELWLFRDLIGKKPLYYAQIQDKFYFASEAKALHKLLGFNLNRRNLHNFLGFGATISPITLDRNIYKLPPASMLYFNGDRSKIESYEELLNCEIEYNTLQEASKALSKSLNSAVDLRIPSGVKWGVLLSGGLDSSLISALASKKSKEPINLFSIGYEGYEKYDEREYAKEVAKYLNANFFEFNFTKADFFSTLDEMLKFIDDPIGDPAQIPLYFLIKKAKEQGVKVLLSGDGSDELFLGYRVYKEYLMMEQVANMPYANWLKNHLKSNFSQNKEWEWYKRALNREPIFRSTAEIYTDRQLNMLLRLQERDGKNFEYLQKYYNRFKSSGRNIIDWYSYCDIKVNLAEYFLVKIDRVSMAAGVEVRTPFIDKEVVETAFKTNPNIRFNPTNVKEIVKEVAKNHLPKSTIERKKKGLSYPFIEWILEDNGIATIYEANKKFNFLKTEHLDYLSSKAKSGKFKQHLFPLYMLSKWLLVIGFTTSDKSFG